MKNPLSQIFLISSSNWWQCLQELSLCPGSLILIPYCCLCIIFILHYTDAVPIEWRINYNDDYNVVLMNNVKGENLSSLVRTWCCECNDIIIVVIAGLLVTRCIFCLAAIWERLLLGWDLVTVTLSDLFNPPSSPYSTNNVHAKFDICYMRNSLLSSHLRPCIKQWDCSMYAIASNEYNLTLLRSVKWYLCARKITCFPWISEMLVHMKSDCVQHTKHHCLWLIPHCKQKLACSTMLFILVYSWAGLHCHLKKNEHGQMSQLWWKPC